MRLAMELFGQLHVSVDGRDVTAQLPGRKGRALLAFLALNAERAVSRDELLDVLWRVQPPADPDAALASVLAKVRRTLGPGVVTGRGTLRLDAAAQPVIDAWVAARAIERAEAVFAAGDAATAIEASQSALATLRQPLLPDLDGDWLERRRAEFDELIPRGLEIAARAGLALGAHQLPAVERAAAALVAREPFREAGYALLMQAQAQQGNAAEALRTFEQLRVLLRDELGAPPSAALLALHESLLRDDAGTVAQPPPPLPAPAPAPSPPLAAPVPAPYPPLAAPVPANDGAFVGRAEVCERLQQRWQECLTDRSCLVLLVGEPGIGKTRLCAEFAERVRAAGATVLYGRADEETLLPHQPFVEALRGLVAGDPQTVQLLSAHDRAMLPHLLPDLAASVGGIAGATGDDQTLRYRLFEAVAALLACASRRAPVLLVLDDLHWADKPSLLLMRHLLRSPRLANVLVLATARALAAGEDHPLRDVVGDLRREHRVDRLDLDGLDERATRELVADRLGREASEGFVRRLCELTKGNAFFLEELVRALVDGGLDPGVAVTEAALDRLGVPAGVADIVERRLRRLSAHAQQVLTAASVVGREFRLGVVAQIVDEPVDVVMGALEESVAAGLVVEDAGSIDVYAFSHALVREVLYEGLGVSRRVRLHHLIAGALEEAADTERINPSELAHHFLLARHFTGDARARGYAILAGDHALGLLAYEEAVEHYSQAAELFGDDEDEERCELLLALGRAQMRAGGEASQATFEAAARAAAARGDADQLARAALGHSARYHESWHAGSGGRELLEQALAALEDGDSARRALLLSRLAEHVAFATHEREPAPRLSAQALAMARRLGDENVLLTALMARHATLLHVRDLDERLRLGEEFMGLQVGRRELLAERHQWRIYDLMEADEVEAARREQPQLDALAAGMRQPLWESIAAGWRGMWAELAGDVELAERCADECLRHGRRAVMKHALSTWAARLLMLRYREGRIAELIGVVEQLVDRADQRRTGMRSAYGLILLETGQEAAARAIYDEELAGFPDALPHFWLTNMAMLTELCVRIGDAAGARVLYEGLQPYARRQVMVVYASCWGPVERYLALLAQVRGDRDARRRHAASALERSQAMGATLLAAEIAGRHAEVLDEVPGGA